MQNVIAIVSAAAALAAVAGSWRVYANQREQSHFALVLALHQDLTTGEVARARDRLGGIQYGDEPIKGTVSTADALHSYFTILWCFERIRAGDRTLRAHSRRLRANYAKTTPALRLLYDMIDWHVNEWHGYISELRQAMTDRLGKSPDDRDSVIALTEIAEILRVAGYQMQIPASSQTPGA